MGLPGGLIWKVDAIRKYKWQFVFPDRTSILGFPSDLACSQKYTCITKGVTPGNVVKGDGGMLHQLAA